MKIIEIKKEDIFKILSQRAQRSVRNLKDENFDQSLFFHESVQVLKNIEFFVDNIFNRVITSLSIYEEAVKNNDQKRLDKIHLTFSTLRFHRNMMKLPNVRFSDNFNIFKKIYINPEIPKKLQQRLWMAGVTDLEELHLLNQSFFQIDDINIAIDRNWNVDSLMCAELAGDFHLGDSRQLTDRSLLPFDLVSENPSPFEFFADYKITQCIL